MYLITYTYPMLCSITKKTVRHPSSSSTPSNPLLFSPAIIFKNAKNDSIISDPSRSSMVVGVPGGLLPDISPISCNEVGQGEELGGVVEASPTDDGTERVTGGEFKEPRKVLSRQKLFPSTPCKDVHMEVSVLA